VEYLSLIPIKEKSAKAKTCCQKSTSCSKDKEKTAEVKAETKTN